MGLADAGWADEQHVGGGVEVAAGGELGDESAIERVGHDFTGYVAFDAARVIIE